jgi:hypothetical protein
MNMTNSNIDLNITFSFITGSLISSLQFQISDFVSLFAIKINNVFLNDHLIVEWNCHQITCVFTQTTQLNSKLNYSGLFVEMFI